VVVSATSRAVHEAAAPQRASSNSRIDTADTRRQHRPR